MILKLIMQELEADLHLQSKEKITTENECNLIYHMSAVA